MIHPADEKKDEDNQLQATITKTIMLIRHGQALHNVDSRNYWTADNPLTKEGEAQLQKMREKLLTQHKKQFYDKIQVVISSPLLRALQTSHILFDQTKKPMSVSPHHTEVYSATCDEGTKKAKLLKQHPIFQTYEGWQSLPDGIWWPTDDETDQQVLQRHTAFAHYLISHEKQCIAAVGHGTFFRTFTARFANKQHVFDNGEVMVYKLKYEKQQYSLKHIHRITPPK